MTDEKWNPWKLTTLGMALVIVTALVTGLVVASWNSGEKPATTTASESKPAGKLERPRPTASSGAATGAPAPRVAATPAPIPVPTAADVEACNARAKNQAGDKTLEVVKDAAIGGALGAGVGAAGGAIAGAGKGAGKGAGVGAVVGVAAGTLYGLNENKSNDARYVEAYRSCMRGRGYTS